MKRDMISFAAGILVGAILGILVSDEEKKRVQQTLHKKAAKLREGYEGPILETANKVKDFVTGLSPIPWGKHKS